MHCVEKSIKLFPLAVCQKLKISRNCHSVNFPIFKTVSLSKKRNAGGKVSHSNSVNVSNLQYSLAVCQKLCFAKKSYKPAKKTHKNGKGVKERAGGQKEEGRAIKNHFYFSVDHPNINVLSLLWSPACFATERNSTLGKTAGRNLEIQDLDHSLTNMPIYSVEKGFKQIGTKIYKCDGLT